jgi:peptide-methionine (R)-S-oxide reductase
MKLLYFSVLFFLISCSAGKNKTIIMEDNIKQPVIKKSKKEWKSVLTDHQYYVMIEKGTERPYTGEYWDVFKEGIYKCAACGEPLFDSGTKFDAHCGWPSFYDAMDSSKIKTAEDYKLGYKRVEIMCAKCGAHLGHVFPDGPNPTGMRYCVNSASIKLEEK